MSGTLVLGIGSRLGGDDAAGGYLVRELHRRLKQVAPPAPDVNAIDAATAPESYTAVVRKMRPALLVLVDTADMGLSPGSVRQIPPDRITIASFSTHRMPLSAFMTYVSEFCGQVRLVGIQPAHMETGEGMSAAVRRSARELAGAILEGRLSKIPLLE